MNKFKKIAAAAVSTALAGTMLFSLAACNPDKPDEGFKPSGGADNYGILKEDGTINYDAYKRDSEVTLNLAVGHEKLPTSTSFRSLGQEITLPNGTTYSDGDFKPAWVQLGKDLNVKFNDIWTGDKTSNNLKVLRETKDTATNQPLYDKTDLFTSDLSKIVSAVTEKVDILNLADYLDYMPNFKIFLESNPVVYLSLLQEGMNTTTGTGKKIYVAPYFDGYDAIERYCILRQDWVAELLNGDTAPAGSAKYSEACAETTSAKAFMGNEAYEIQSLSADGKSTITIKKDYAKALNAAKNESSALGAAYKDIAGAVYSGTSGNIIDIMNVALAANKDATGAQLVALYRAYIDACYQKDGAAYFNSSNRANVFNGYDACWDVDDLVAMLRCIKTNASALGVTGTIGGIYPRSGQNDRTPDVVRLACQLYGVRGAESRNEYTYIAKDGTIKDARASAEIYNACANFNLLYQEGLIANYSAFNDTFKVDGGALKGDDQYFMIYDYVQTQTKNGFYAEDASVTGVDTPEGYKFSPVLTPVSKWDVDGDGNHTDIMRFTESWRSTKTGGLGLNGNLAKPGNEAKLKAALQLVDYLYSEDGQIVSTYGPMAENADGKGGFWYNEKATDAQVSAGNYFTYKGVKYSGYMFEGKATPTITSKLYDSFNGKTVNEWATSSNSNVSGAKLSFTNYARYLIGSTLPVGVKNQSFENQLTSKMGQEGANKVGTALDKGVVKGMSLKIDANNYWYTCAPTSLPVDSNVQKSILDSSAHKNFMYMTGTQKDNKNFGSIFNNIIVRGTNANYNQQDVSFDYTSIANILEQTLGNDVTVQRTAEQRQTAYNQAWETAKNYWTYISGSAK